MKKWTGVLALLLLPAAGVAEESKHADKKNAEPFYAKYLVKGNLLDDQIVEQAQRVAASPQDAGLRNDFGNLLARRRFPEQAAEPVSNTQLRAHETTQDLVSPLLV
jgi:hypothetical protein